MTESEEPLVESNQILIPETGERERRKSWVRSGQQENFENREGGGDHRFLDLSTFTGSIAG